MQNLAKQRVVSHPNKLILKFDQYLADKNLANKLKNAKSSLPSINPGFQKRLDDRRKKELNSSSGLQEHDLSIICNNMAEQYRHQTSIPKERDGSCVKIVKSAKRLGSVERENDEPVMKLRQKGEMGFPPTYKKMGGCKLGGDFDVLDWLSRDQMGSRGSKPPSAGEMKTVTSPKPINHFPRRPDLPPLPTKDYILRGSHAQESTLPPFAVSKRAEMVKTPDVQQLRFSLDGRLAAKAQNRRYCSEVSTDYGDEEPNNDIVKIPSYKVPAVVETVEDDSPVLPAKSRMSLIHSEFKIVARNIEALEDTLPVNQTVQAEEDDEVILY